VRGDHLLLKVRCPAAFTACHAGTVNVQAAPKHGAKRTHLQASRRFFVAKGSWHARGGRTKSLRLGLSKAGRRWFAHHRRLRTRVTVRSAENSRADRHFRAAKKIR
jgi:hypothetical protein